MSTLSELHREFWRLQKLWAKTPDGSPEEKAAAEKAEAAWKVYNEAYRLKKVRQDIGAVI